MKKMNTLTYSIQDTSLARFESGGLMTRCDFGLIL